MTQSANISWPPARGAGGGGGGDGGLLTQVLTAAHIDGATLIVSGDTIKSSSVGADGELTMVYKTVANAQDGLREASGYALDITDIFPTYDSQLHLLSAFIYSPAMDTNTGIGIALVSAPGAGAVGAGFHASGLSRVSSQGVTSAPAGGGTSPTAWARGVFTPANVGHATLRNFEIQVYKADGTVTYTSPGSNYLVSLAGSVQSAGLQLFINALTVGAVTEDDEAVARILFCMEDIPVPP